MMKHFRLMVLAAAAFLASCAGKPAQEQANPLATKVVVTVSCVRGDTWLSELPTSRPTSMPPQ